MNADELMANSWIKMEFIGIIKLAQVNAKCSFLGTKLIYDALCAHWRERDGRDWEGFVQHRKKKKESCPELFIEQEQISS